MSQYVYYRGSQSSRETVTYDIVRGSEYITSAWLIKFLLGGIKAFRPAATGTT